ncbi:hypothetical protein CVU76_02050 [Candidatus Dojkabacteria bacterium HGW-Dojkabacteria-1]|uniref:Transglutaminase-like domain-containing protein n=1 Tax=Candidatus Dojkabacteria bacterium HGW-Dojkabacteria-1 TaxID=2013761 RepID=A0A2N2F3K9_9BACT|nr:MAG: hypothetical protein CVU76_02050 [Candidatus Dojkabacteria bacterium HGW-Dojkabacteria-1]
MKNLNGYLKRILLIFSIVFAFAIFQFPLNNKAQALDGFDIKSDFNHVWDGETISSTIYVTITTVSNPRVITFYTITIPQENLRPEVYSINKNIKLEPTYYNRKDATDMVIDLKNTVVSQENPVTLKLVFQTPYSSDNLSLISSIKDTSSRSFSFTYPKSFGEISWSSSPVTKITQKGENLEIETAPPQSLKVNISLGKKISYSFSISRNLINSTEEMISSEINIPPNTNTQKISLTEITPKPNKSYKDINGNYILQYEIAPQSNIEVSIKGNIEMDKTIYTKISTPNIENRSLWEIKNTDLEKRIQKFIKENLNTKESTIDDVYDMKDQSQQEILYRALYQFVIDNLEPNTLTIGSLAGSARLGGERALSEQAQSTSEDYADAIIAIYRKFKIPARLVIGYVTNISDYHPDGMYHYWAEYFDIEKKDWIQVDPFLEDYSNTSLWGRELYDHVTLLYRYDNPNNPKLSYFSENDFKISLNNETIEKKYELSTQIYLQPYKFIDSHLQGSVKVKNLGNTVIDRLEIVKSNPDISKYTDYIENNSTTLLLPEDTVDIKFNIPSLKIESPMYVVLRGYSGTQEIEGEYAETSIEYLENNLPIKILSKLMSILLYIVIAIPLYFLTKKLLNKNG